MGVKKFEIVLDNPVWYSGRNITGKLLVDVEKSVTIRGIRLNYLGKGNVHWNEGPSQHKRACSSTITYLNLQQLAYGDYNKKSKLAAGQYVFVFSCELPKDSPCSFEGEFGHIRYSIKANMDIPWARDPVAQQSVTVVSVFDLNDHPLAAAPISEQTSKTFWGQANALSMAFELPVRGYVPGQVMSVAVYLNNQTDIVVEKISAELHQNTIFHANEISKDWDKLIANAEYPIKDLGCTHGVLNITVPELTPSYLEFCSIIDLKYHLTVVAVVSGLHSNLKSSTEILMGNVPLITSEKPNDNQDLTAPA